MRVPDDKQSEVSSHLARLYLNGSKIIIKKQPPLLRQLYKHPPSDDGRNNGPRPSATSHHTFVSPLISALSSVFVLVLVHRAAEKAR